MEHEKLFPLIRQKTGEMLNGYVKTPEMKDLDHYIVPASLKGNQGIMGCLKLALDAMKNENC